ncbi:TPA: hypothetical protein DIC20_03410 [Candidatus Dependentiae bacterium]|nr:hypothetical protein [Candidatus Dependentiae bacterium]HCU00723.1 hypothetical protein [Candidatus Dependentiae bacterium]
MSLKKIFLILLLSATALNAEKTSLSATDLNTEKVSLSSTALNATKAPLIRDVSWTGYIYYEPGSFYVLLDPIYEDKISLLEEQWGETNFIFSWLGSFIPRSWNINVGKNTTVWNYDALDALYVGIQGANTEITQASINLLPITKAIVPSGKTTDYRLKEIVVNGKLDLSQFMELNYKCMAAKINKSRVNKAICFATAGAIALGTTKPTFISKLLSEGTSLDAKKITDLLSKHLPTWATEKSYLLTALPLIAAAGTQRLENIYINGYVKNFEILMNSEKVVFDKQKAQKMLSKLIKKLKRFGFGKNYAHRLGILLQNL